MLIDSFAHLLYALGLTLGVCEARRVSLFFQVNLIELVDGQLTGSSAFELEQALPDRLLTNLHHLDDLPHRPVKVVDSRSNQQS